MSKKNKKKKKTLKKEEKYFKLSKNQDPKYFAQAQKQYNAVAKLIRGKNGRN